jgi:hypothetical protein
VKGSTYLGGTKGLKVRVGAGYLWGTRGLSVGGQEGRGYVNAAHRGNKRVKGPLTFQRATTKQRPVKSSELCAKSSNNYSQLVILHRSYLQSYLHTQ